MSRARGCCCVVLAAVAGLAVGAEPVYRSPVDVACAPDGSVLAVSDHTAGKLALVKGDGSAIAREAALKGEPAAGGETIRVGDVKGQIEVTLDAIDAILCAEGYAWQDVSRAIAYVREGVDWRPFHRVVKERGLPRWPIIVKENDICRDDLLFELELDAWRVEP